MTDIVSLEIDKAEHIQNGIECNQVWGYERAFEPDL
jgi:hypothetical protein